MKESCGRLMLIITKAEKLSRPGNPGKIQEPGLLGTDQVFGPYSMTYPIIKEEKE